MLACNETITLIRHIADTDGDRYECEVIAGVSWYGKRGDKPSANAGEAPQTEYTVRIPAAHAPEQLPQAGDLVVRGILPFYDGKAADLKKHEWFRISRVGDNRRGRSLPHIVVKNA